MFIVKEIQNDAEARVTIDQSVRMHKAEEVIWKKQAFYNCQTASSKLYT